MSMKNRIILLNCIFLLLVWIVISLWMSYKIKKDIEIIMDNRLHSLALMIDQTINKKNLNANNSKNINNHYVDKNGKLLIGEISNGINNHSEKWGLRISEGYGINAPSGYSSFPQNGTLWRVFMLQAGAHRIAVADDSSSRTSIEKDILLSLIVPFIAIFPLLLCIFLYMLYKEFREFEILCRHVKSRKPDEWFPLPQSSIPCELRPLVMTSQSLLIQVQQTLRRERNFTSDIAHELRTPLSGINKNIQISKMAIDSTSSLEIIRKSLEDAESGIIRLQEIMDNLFTLARAEIDAACMPAERTDITIITKKLLSSLYHKYPDARKRIRHYIPEEQIEVNIPDSLYFISVRNLLDNALKYTSETSIVYLRIFSKKNSSVHIMIEDEGIGMAGDALSTSSLYLWRKGYDTTGNGLGLSIVETIMKRYNGTLNISISKKGGLIAELIMQHCHDKSNSP